MSSALTSDLSALAQFSETDRGVTRVAWSDELFSAYNWVSSRAGKAGLTSRIDGAGNLHLDLQRGEAERIIIGSHLDTVPHGGCFDGALGVLGGLEAVRILQREDAAPPFPTSITAFMDEEGTRFGTTLFGSRAFVGDDVSPDLERTDGTGITLSEAMAAHDRSIESVREAFAVGNVAAYLELHIEQGPVLEDEEAQLGIVTSIVGLIGLSVTLVGEANHAGTTPMHRRRDALVGAARVTHELRERARRTKGMTANVGTIAVEPSGKNVVPGVCTFTIDVRAATPGGFSALQDDVQAILTTIASDEGLDVEVMELYRLEPVVMDTGLLDLLEEAAESAGAVFLRLPSGAGHDAMALGRHVPSAMLFVPSRGGISHSPDEHTSAEHCDLGAEVLARALRLLGARSSGSAAR
jgi:allantoate deiminase